MKYPLIAAASLTIFLGVPAMADTILEDGFESGSLSLPWIVSTTNQGRAEVSQDFNPAEGTSHLVLDDHTSDATFSNAEATVELDLSGMRNVVLTFEAKSLGDEGHPAPTGNFVGLRNYDGVAVSADGGNTWHSVQSLSETGLDWTSYSLTLDAAVESLGATFGPGFQIRFSQYDNSSAPLDGLAIDDVRISADVDLRALVELPSVVMEGGGPYTGHVFLALPATDDTLIDLVGSSPALVGIPSAVTFAPGESSATFQFSVADDEVLSFARRLTITPSGAGFAGISGSVSVIDDEVPPQPTLQLPASVTEGESPTDNASISIATPLSDPVEFTISAAPSSQLLLPSSVVLPAGETTVLFTVRAFDDSLEDGGIMVDVTATSALLGDAVAKTLTVDDEPPLLKVTLPAEVAEGSSAPGMISVAHPAGAELTIELSSSLAGALSLPVSVTIPKGQSSVPFDVEAVDDGLFNQSRTVTVTAGAIGALPGQADLVIRDDEPAPVISLALPESLTEGTAPSPKNNASIILSVPSSAVFRISLDSDPSNQVIHPSSVAIPAGQTQFTFSLAASDDSEIDGTVSVTVTASAAGLEPGKGLVEVLDNEDTNIALSVPEILTEGDTASGTVSISGGLPTPLTVDLRTSGGGAIPLLPTVTIAAGETSASFTIVAEDNTERDGTRTVSFEASAAGFAGGRADVVVRDDDVAAYVFNEFPDIVNLSDPVAVRVSGEDIEGNAIPGFSRQVNLSIVLPDGAAQPVDPESVVVSGDSGWSGTVTLPEIAGSPLRLRATDADGITGDSSAFDGLRSLSLETNDIIWDEPRGVIYASIPTSASSEFANRVVSIDPATLRVTDSVVVNQDPGQLALTSGGEALYVALKANGSITKIDLQDFTVEMNFPVGTSPSYGTLFVDDMSTVEGQPDLLVVSQFRKSVSPRHDGVAVYDNGVMRPVETRDHTGSNIIEPSADPTIFFGYNTGSTEFGLRTLQLGPEGMTQLEVKGGIFSGFSIDMRSSGDLLFSTTGAVADGALLKRVGTIPASGPVVPDAASGRVFFIERNTSNFFSSHETIGAYDSTAFSLIRRLTLPAPVADPMSLIRWGANGLAFRTETSVNVIVSSRLVPSAPPADLEVEVLAAPNPTSVGGTLTYTVEVNNAGPNAAKNVAVNAVLSEGQTLTSTDSSAGTPSLSGLTVSLAIPEIASGASATITIAATPEVAGSLTCTTSAVSDSVDPDFLNNTGFALVSVGFESSIDVVNELRLEANNLVYDPTRELLWASIDSTVDAPLGKSIVSIDPMTGLVSQPIPINADPFANSMAISDNGRYLYVGLRDIPEVHRIELAAPGTPSIRIPLALSNWNRPNFAQDIEVLGGDGTSFLMSGIDDHSASVYDGTEMRPATTGIYSVDRVEGTNDPNIFIGYNNSTTAYNLTRLSVTESGVAEALNVRDVIRGSRAEIQTDGERILSSSGLLVDAGSLSLETNFGIVGRPCLDLVNQRAYFVSGSTVHAFESNTGNSAGSFALPTTASGDWAEKCLRWGTSGFAVLGDADQIFITRWSEANPAGVDTDKDGFADAWELEHFGTLDVDLKVDYDGDGIPTPLEYLFATSPMLSSAKTMQTSTVNQGEDHFLRLVFPRRAGLPASFYRFETTTDFSGWASAIGMTENVVSRATINGIQIETVEALVPCPPGDSTFVRIVKPE